MPDWCSSAPGSSRLSLEPAILQRLRSAGALPTPLRTSLGSSWLLRWWPAAPAQRKRRRPIPSLLLFGYGLLQLLFCSV